MSPAGSPSAVAVVVRDPAPARDRLLAAAVDLLPVLVLLVAAPVVPAVTGWPGWVALVLVGAAAAWSGVLWWSAAADGRTVGKRLLGLREIDEATGGAPGAGAALLRLVLRGAVALLTLGVAGLSYRWDPAGRERTWWDRLAGTAVAPDEPGILEGDRGAARWAPGGAVARVGAVSGPGGGVRPGFGSGLGPGVAAGAGLGAGVVGGAGVAVVPGAGPGGAPRVGAAAPPRGWVPSPVPPVPGPSRLAAGSAVPDAEFLPQPLIGDDSRGVPARPAAGEDAAPRPGLIVGIGDTGAPVVDAAPSPAPQQPVLQQLAPRQPAPPQPAPRPPDRPQPAPRQPAPPQPAPPQPARQQSAPRHRAPVEPPTRAAAPSSSSAVHSPAPVPPSSVPPPSPPPQASPVPVSPAPAPPEPVRVPRRPARLDPLSTVRLPPAEAVLVWDTGRHVTVTGRVLIGRDPVPADGEQVDQVLPVSTDSVGVSKTHLHIDVGRDRILVTDRRSTNGVRVVHADGTVDRCPPGEPIPVEPGDALHFGGRHVTLA